MKKIHIALLVIPIVLLSVFLINACENTAPIESPTEHLSEIDLQNAADMEAVLQTLEKVESDTADDEPKFMTEDGLDIVEYNTDDQKLTILKERIKEGESLLNKYGGYRQIWDIETENYGNYNELTVRGLLSHEASWQGSDPPPKNSNKEKDGDGVKNIQHHQMLFGSMTDCEPWTYLFYMKAGLTVKWKHGSQPWQTLLGWGFVSQHYTDFVGQSYFKDYMAKGEAKAYGYHYAYNNNSQSGCNGCFYKNVYFQKNTYTYNYTWF